MRIFKEKDIPGSIARIIVGDKDTIHDKRHTMFLLAVGLAGLTILGAGAEFAINGKKGIVGELLYGKTGGVRTVQLPAATTAFVPTAPALAPTAKKSSVATTVSGIKQKENKEAGELLTQIKKISGEKSVLIKELARLRKNGFQLKKFKEENKKSRKEKERLNKQVKNLNAILANLKKEKKKPAPALTGPEKTMAELKKTLIAYGERERRRPDLNKRLNEYKKRLDESEAERAAILNTLESRQGEIKALKVKEKESAELKKTLDKTRNQLLTARETAAAEGSILHYNMGVIFTKNNRHGEALEEFNKALAYKEDDPDIHFNLAVLYDDYLHVHDKAVEHYRRYLELAPETGDRVMVEKWLKDAEKYLEE